MSHVAFFCLCGLLAMANQGLAMQCYSCSVCGSEPFSTVGAATVNCSSNLCFTTTSTASLLGITTTAISRGCAINGTATGCTSGGAGVSSLAGGSASTCTCSGDKCNGASSSAAAGLATQCYSCLNCGSEPFSTVGAATVTCSSNLCFTTTATASLLGITTTAISRGCAINGTATGCTSGGAGVGSLAGGSASTCTCSGDKCNGASSSAAAGSSLCYSCDDCGDDPFSTSGALTVSCSSNLCEKSKFSVTLLGTTTTVVSRGCGTVGTSTGCISGGGGLGSFVGGSGSTCTCSGAKCNTGAFHAPSTAAIVLSLAAILSFR